MASMSENSHRTILVSGGAGFIGSAFIMHMLSLHTDIRIINVDALTYAGNLENLQSIENNPRHIFIHAEIQNTELMHSLCEQYAVEGIINIAAESHVDRSIHDASPFVETNIQGTVSLLTVARNLKLNKFVQVSTDEVYGSLELDSNDAFTETTPLAPNSPYSASKASADMFVRAFHHTHDVPAIITRCSNNYGPRQFPEKLIPLMILNAMESKSLPVYGDGLNVRDWIHVNDHCEAIDRAYHFGIPGEVYNIGSDNEYTNLDIVKSILAILGKSEDLIQYVQDRPGHDRRYAIDASKAKKELHWMPRITFEQGLNDTVKWYLENAEWYKHVLSGEYRDYYSQQYHRER
jgi:dTDP-glucose 4,6-dehydratase